MKKIIVLIALTVIYQWTLACPLCEQSQPRIFRGITHGTGPQSNWDFVIIAGAMTVVTCCLYFSIRYLIKPGETNNNHIKNSIFNTAEHGR